MSLKHLHPEDYTYIGSYTTSPWGGFFWARWYRTDLAQEVGIKTDFGGWCMFAGRQVFHHSEAIKKVTDELFEKIVSKNDSFFLNIAKCAEREFSNALNFVESLQKKNMTDDEKLQHLIDHAERVQFFWCLGWQLSQVIDKFLHDKALETNIFINEIISQLPKVISPLTQQQEEMRKLKALLVKNGIWNEDLRETIKSLENNNDFLEKLKFHIDEYGWILNIDWVGDEFTLEKLLDQMSHVQEDETIAENDLTKHKVPFLEDYEFLFQCGNINQSGSEYLSIIAHKASCFLNNLAHKCAITREDMRLLLPTELLDKDLSYDSLHEKIDQRKNNNWFLYTSSDNKATIIDEHFDVEILSREFMPRSSVDHSMEIRGSIGNKGVGRGHVKVMVGPSDFYKMEKDDVIVTPMTTPDYVLLMQKSSAIVTDMGGILSHAAIVSRELGKPCIIGTKFASKVLHDGDLVEVDADNGVVRILEKSKKSTDYVKMFESSNMPFLISNIFLKHYMLLEIVVTSKNDSWISFLSKASQEKTLNEGVKLFGSKKQFTEYEFTFNEYMKRAKEFYEKIILKHEITKSELKIFFDLFGELFLYYQKTESFYVDRAFIESEQNGVISQNLKKLEALKQSGREFMNNMIYGKSNYLIKVIEILSKNLKIAVDDLLFYSKKEILDIFDNIKVSDEVVRDRKMSYVFIVNKNKLINYCGKESEEYISNFIVNHKTSEEIKGIVASPGKVTGKARIFMYSVDGFDNVPEMIEKMEEGEVLVAETTSPELMAACKKASAILTNQGGLLSHAAIVSREFKIPCIVGLGDITHVLKDGDLVEVDADNGKVKILKRAK